MLSKIAIFLCVAFVACGLVESSFSSLIWHYFHKGITISVGGEDYRELLLSGQMPYQSRGFLLLYQPEIDRAVSLVDIKSDGGVVLNPSQVSFDSSWKINYGDVPALDQLTTDKLNALWGRPIAIYADASRYALSTCPPVWYTFVKSVPPANFYIDAKFENDHLKSYRFRYSGGDSKLNTKWRNIDEK